MDGRRALGAAAERLEGFARRRLALLRPRGGLPGGLAPLVGTYAAWNPWTPELRVRPDATPSGPGSRPWSRAAPCSWWCPAGRSTGSTDAAHPTT
ncbi:MAG TPA: hypothetical protein VIM97_06920 [Actinomycetes bacterium]